MDPGQLEQLAVSVESVTIDGGSQQQGDLSTPHIVRICEQIYAQTFEMEVKILAGKSKRSWNPSDAERALPEYVSELEQAETSRYIKTMGLHRIHTQHCISEKLKGNDPNAKAMRLTNESMDTFSDISTLEQESYELQDQITELQKQRLGLKHQTCERMKEMEMDELKSSQLSNSSNTSMTQRGQASLQKQWDITIMIQHVLMGLMLSLKMDWADPRTRDIALSLEETPLD